MTRNSSTSPQVPLTPTDPSKGEAAPPAYRPWLPEEQLRPAYPVPYGPAQVPAIAEVLFRIHHYLDYSTQMRVIDKRDGQPITDLSRPHPHADLAPMAFRTICYEWGVLYGAMMRAAEATGDARFRDYTSTRLQTIVDLAGYFRSVADLIGPEGTSKLAFRSVLQPRNLDDAGSMAAALIKADRAGLIQRARPQIDRYLSYVMQEQFRLGDRTFARNRPVPRTLWLDDLYMSVPALAQMGLLTGESGYFDEAVLQVKQFAARMFNLQKRLYCHGWVESMSVHPEFRWARCNGWALLAKTELLDALPQHHPGREGVLELLRQHIRGLAECQSGQGRWHQLLDRNDSYQETSASAIFVYCMAHAINRGWIDPLAYGPVAKLGWNAIAAQVNPQGQVEGTCVGSGLAFDPMFYYYRPTSSLAAHGYGPMILAGAEMILLTQTGRATIHDSAVHFGETREEA